MVMINLIASIFCMAGAVMQIMSGNIVFALILGTFSMANLWFWYTYKE